MTDGVLCSSCVYNMLGMDGRLVSERLTVIPAYTPQPVEYNGIQQHAMREVALDGSAVVKRIVYHEAKFAGDKHYCEVTLHSGKVKRIFDTVVVTFL